VLLIDDSHEDLFLVKRLLSRAGVKHPIVTIDGGEEAVVYLRACLAPGAAGLTPAVVFCDVKMPGHDGFSVLEWARQHVALRGVPFFILSGGDLEEDRARALGLGATGYLVKFPNGEQLKAILKQVGIL
jgi:two-component system chemotaxis response regulator CheY